MELKLDKLLDKYAIQARLSPALIALAPLAVALACAVPKPDETFKPLIGLVGASGVLLLVANVARSLGKRVEKGLLDNWGGWPTTTMLRLSDERLDGATKARYRTELKRLLPGLELPSADEEASATKSADNRYRSVATFLIGRTRDQKAFPLVFAENISYGFRRNLLGLKPVGIACSVLGSSLCAWRAHAVSWGTLQLTGLGVSLLFLACWLFTVNGDWVLDSAESYALRLFEAIDKLATESKPQRRTSGKRNAGKAGE